MVDVYGCCTPNETPLGSAPQLGTGWSCCENLIIHTLKNKNLKKMLVENNKKEGVKSLFINSPSKGIDNGNYVAKIVGNSIDYIQIKVDLQIAQVKVQIDNFPAFMASIVNTTIDSIKQLETGGTVNLTISENTKGYKQASI